MKYKQDGYAKTPEEVMEYATNIELTRDALRATTEVDIRLSIPAEEVEMQKWIEKVMKKKFGV